MYDLPPENFLLINVLPYSATVRYEMLKNTYFLELQKFVKPGSAELVADEMLTPKSLDYFGGRRKYEKDLYHHYAGSHWRFPESE